MMTVLLLAVMAVIAHAQYARSSVNPPSFSSYERFWFGRSDGASAAMQAAVDEALSLAREDFTVQRATMFGTGRGYEALYIQMALAARGWVFHKL